MPCSVLLPGGPPLVAPKDTTTRTPTHAVRFGLGEGARDVDGEIGAELSKVIAEYLEANRHVAAPPPRDPTTWPRRPRVTSPRDPTA